MKRVESELKMLQVLYTLLFLSLMVSGILAKFQTGRLKPGQFEYPKLNGWMVVNEAVDRCEADLACGGFTFKGSYKTKNVKMDVYFFHIVKRNTKSPLEQRSLKELLFRCNYLKQKFPYLNRISEMVVTKREKYHYWSTYEVERGYVTVSNTKLKSIHSSQMING